MLFKIAFRNVFRNRRRSLMTLLAIAVGAVAIVLFGDFIGFIRVALKTMTIERVGHLTVFRSGYFDYGAGNPLAFGIDDYQGVMGLIQNDAEIKPLLNVITPTVSVAGIAGNFDISASKTFFGTGFVPSDRDRMLLWDEQGVFTGRVRKPSGLHDDDEVGGVVGVGLARVLGFCDSLGIKNCPARPPAVAPPSAAEKEAPDIAALAGAEQDEGPTSPGDARPRLDLLAATAGGAPNVISLFINSAERQSARELDESFIAMHLKLAQRLLYGRNEPKAMAIVLQLHQTKDTDVVRARLKAIFQQHHLDLEVRDFVERQPFYKEAVDMFDAIFLFIAAIMGVIVLFTVVNTMGMSVMERTNEIGTARALGVRRSGTRNVFLIEGILLGAFGATVGVIVGQVIAMAFNHTGFTWTPPGNAAPTPLRVLTSGVMPLLLGAWLGLVLMATVAAVIPANRAARLKVVDALRHV